MSACDQSALMELACGQTPTPNISRQRMNRDPMDIKAKAPFPAGMLSNFAPHAFVLDGVACASMEGLLQSLKIADVPTQRKTCTLVGVQAQRAGRAYDWASGTLWWGGRPFDRLSDAYQGLLDRAYDALFDQAQTFRDALRATDGRPLTHEMGRSDPCETILTAQEFCQRLERLRERLGEDRWRGDPVRTSRRSLAAGRR